MKKNNKNIVISIFVFIIILLLSISIVIANNANNKANFEIDEEKIYYEIKYFDSQIVYMINSLNNIEGNNNFYINWLELQKRTEILYSYWNSAILDFNHLNIDKKHLTDFGKYLDELTIAINNNDKGLTLSNLMELYNKLIIYSEGINYENYNNILLTKYNLLLAYSNVEIGNWTLIHEYILKSSEYIYKVVSSMEITNYNQYNLNQAYVSIKELENLINIKDINVFYIKYIIAINKLENLTFS